MCIEGLSFTEDFRVLKNNDVVIMVNKDNGNKLKVSKQCYELLEAITENKITLKEVIDNLEDKEDKEYFNSLIQILLDYKILQSNSCCKINKRFEKVMFKVTNRCNLNCIHCSVRANEKADKQKELNFQNIRKVIDMIAAHNPESIVFTGGEPLVREDLFDILEYAYSKFSGEFRLMTNGTLIDENNVEKIIKYFKSIDISIDGVDEESCSVIRGDGVFTKVVNSVKLLQSRGFNNISLSIVEVEQNKKLIGRFEALNKELNTKPIVRIFADIGRGEDSREILEVKNKYVNCLNTFDSAVVDKLDKKKLFSMLKVCTCGAGKREMMIDEVGDVYPCALLNSSEYKLCSIFNLKTLEEALEKFKCGYESNLMKYQAEYFEACRDCNVNLFCWSCIEEIGRLSKHPEKFKLRCENNKKMLEKLVW